MHVMDLTNLWNLQGQLFCLFVVGLLLRRIGLFAETSKSMLTDLVLYVTLPCSIILSFQFELDYQLFVSFVVIFFFSVGVQGFCFLLTRISFRTVDPDKKSVLHYGLLVSNSGFLGLPIVGELFGPAGLMYASVYLIVQRVVIWTAGLSLFCPAAVNKKQAVLSVALHPCMISMYVGLFLMLFSVRLPVFLDMTLSSLGGCTTALSMMLIGSLFGKMQKKQIRLDRNLILFSLLRLLLIPLVSLFTGRLLSIDPLLVGVAVILAAMPGGSSTVILASKYGRDTTYASKMVIISTLLSLLSIPVWSLVLNF